MTAQLEVYTFGGLRILRGGEPVTGLASRKVEALLVYLACTDRSQPREVLADFLWDDFSQTRAMNNLRVVLSNLRKHLGEYLIITRESVAMNPESNFRLDVVELEAALKAARARESRLGEQTSEAAAQLEAAVAHYQGEFLEGFSVRGSRGFDQWFSVERERLHRIVLNALRRLVSWHVVQGQFMKGIEQATRWLQLDPIAEAAHRQMMLLLAYSGQQGEALKQYETCLRVLAQELGTEPSAETEALYQKLLSGEPLPSIKPTGGLATRPPRVVGPCPYRGLAAFREEDAPFFFGREALVQQLAEAVRQRALVHVIVGSSGSGKSSVVYAGLLPRLREDGDWLIAQARPGSQPFQAAAAALLTLLEPELSEADRLIETQKLGQALTRGDVTLDSVARRTLEKDGNSSRLLLLLDQFEEIYTLCPDDELRRRYLDQLLAAVASSSLQRIPALVFLLTLRADFMGQALGHRPFADTLQDAAFMIGPMTAEELQQAIQKPAELQGAAFEDGLVERILKDVGQEPGHLPLLEFALTLLWEKQKDGWLTHADYEEIGQVEGALARYADQVMDKLIQDEQEQARRIFVQLVRPGQGTEDTRRVATRSELGEDHWSLVRHLADRRLVVTGREESSDRETAEVVHEALIQRWGRLREWMAADRTFRTWQERLRVGLQGWQASRSDEGALLRGGPLAEAEDWLAQRAAQMSAAEREYIEASAALRQRREQEREAQRQRELEAAHHLAESEKRRAEEQALAAGQLRRRALFLTGALFISGILAVVAIVFGQRAGQNERNAIAQEATAVAEAAQRAAIQATAEADARTAFSRELAAAALNNLNVDPERSILLSLHGLSVAHTREAEEALHQAIQASRVRLALSGHTAEIWRVAFSQDGERLATVSSDGTAKVWDAVSGRELLTLSGHTDIAWDVEFDPSGLRIATSSSDGTARVWSATSGQELFTMAGHPEVYPVAFSPDGTQLATGGSDGVVKVWDATTGQEVFSLTGHTGFLADIAFSPDGTRVATGSGDRTAKVWDISTPFNTSASSDRELYSLTDFTGPVSGVAFDPDGERLVTSSGDGSIRVWDVATGQLSFSVTGNNPSFTRVTFSPGGEHLAAGSITGTPIVWNIFSEGAGERFALAGHIGSVWGLAFSPDGRRLATAGEEGSVRIWDVSSSAGRELLVVGERSHVSFVRRVALSQDGTRLATAGFADATAKVWDAGSGRELLSLSAHAGPVTDVTFNPASTRLATASSDGTVKLWDVNSGQELLTLSGHGTGFVGGLPMGAIALDFSPDGSRLATTGVGGTAKVWDANTGRELHTLFSNNDAVTAVKFSSDGKLLATLNWHSGPENLLGTAKIWNAETGQELLTLSGLPSIVWDLAFSPDGTQLVTPGPAPGGSMGMVSVWDATTGQALFDLSGHTNVVIGMAYSPDGKRIATASLDGTARIWDASSGQALLTLFGSMQGVSHVAFSQDGARLATSNADGTARLYVLPIEDLVALAQSRVTRSLTTQECRDFLHMDACPNE